MAGTIRPGLAENAQPHERYDYLYKVQELEPWAIA
jgi:hypothetical protein